MKPIHATYQHPVNSSDSSLSPKLRVMSFRRKVLLPLAIVLPFTLFSTGCANMPKATSISAGGALAGAAIGAQSGGLRGALVGAVIGGVIGNQIGAHLDEQDQKKLVELEMMSLDSGKSTSFITNKDKSKITVTPGAAQVETVRKYSLSSDVKEYQLKMAATQEIPAFVDTPVFSNIDEKSSPKLIIKKGAIIHTQANVDNNPKWVAIVESDTVVGYVPLRYLDKKIVKVEKSEKAKLAKLEKAKLAKTTSKAAIAANAVSTPGTITSSSNDLTQSTSASVTGKLPMASTPRTPESSARSVLASGTCKTVTRTVVTENKADSYTEKVKYCQEPPPKWKPISI